MTDIFKNINTDEDVYQWIINNIENIDYPHIVKSYETILRDKSGNSHSHSNLIYKLLIDIGIKCYKLFFIEYNPTILLYGNDNVESNIFFEFFPPFTHTITYYEKDDKLYWMETAWDDTNGIHGPYNNINEIENGILAFYRLHSKHVYHKLKFVKYDYLCENITLPEYVRKLLSHDICLGEITYYPNNIKRIEDYQNEKTKERSS